MSFVGLGLEASDQFLPWELLVLLELKQKLVLVAQDCRRGGWSALPALRGRNLVDGSFIIIVSFALLQDRTRIGSDASVRSS